MGELSAATDPSRAMVRLSPKAKESSFPLNHLASAVVTATMSGSAPTPRRKRPAAITRKSEEATVMTPAAVVMAAKSRMDRLVPKRSMRMPPASSTSTAAQL